MRNFGRHSNGFSLLEFLVVITVIGIMMAVALQYLVGHVDQAEKTALKSMSRHMASSMSMLRNKWIVEGRRSSNGVAQVKLDGDLVYLNRHGWPVATQLELIQDKQQPALKCAQLWQLMMQNDVAVTVEGLGVRGDEAYHISAPDENRCRYELARFPETEQYFDYYLSSGEVVVHEN